MLPVPCPGCGLVLAVDPRLAGTAVICSRCQRTVAVPGAPPAGPAAPYPYPYPYPGGGGPWPAAAAAPADPAPGFRIAGGVIGIVAAIVFISSAVGAIATFEPRYGSDVAGLLALLAFGLAIWGVVAASLACTRRRWASAASAWTQIVMVALAAPPFVFDLATGRGSPELREMFRVVFPLSALLSGLAVVFSLLASHRAGRPAGR